ncbi:MAG: TRAP transporter small permease subunit [Deltaproteobacteria bacterium]|nr:TRAP transporter small permease subunit [Deltaproteobacteria bacterium]
MLKRIIKAITLFEEYLLFLMVFQMGLSIFLQVVMRYAFHSAITWLGELVHIEVIFLTFFGASLGIKYGSHICVDALKNIVKDPYHNLLEAFSNLVIAAYVTTVIYFGLNLIIAMTSHPHFTPVLRIPKHDLYLVVCIGLGLIGMRSILQFYQVIASMVSGSAKGVS